MPLTQPLVSTAYMPPVAYMAILAQNRAVTVEAKETYPKQTYRNRAIILTSNGLQNLTIPVERPFGNHTRTDDIGISYNTNWATNHIRTLAAAYGASPYYFYYRDQIEAILAAHHDTLLQLNQKMLQFLIEKMKFSCQTEVSTDFVHPCGDPLDLRSAFSPKRTVEGTFFAPYTQVFSAKFAFEPNLSAIDLLCNLGPESGDYLKKIKIGVNSTKQTN